MPLNSAFLHWSSLKGLLLLGLYFIIFCFAPTASGQGFRIGDAQTVTSALTSTSPIVPLQATVNVCVNPANAVPCTNKASTFTSVTLATPCSAATQVVLAGTTTCVAQTDSRGNWGAWVAAGNYDVTFTLSTGQSFGPYTISVGIPAGANISPGNLTVTGQAIVTNPCTVGGFIYVSTGGCYTTVTQAIASFSGGNCGTIYLPVGTRSENITINSSNACNNPSSQMIIQGSGRRSTIWKPASNAAVITLDSTGGAIQSVRIRDIEFDNTASGFTQPAILMQGSNINDWHRFEHLYIQGGFSNSISSTGRTIQTVIDDVEISGDVGTAGINLVSAGTPQINWNTIHKVKVANGAGTTKGINISCLNTTTCAKQIIEDVDLEVNGGDGLDCNNCDALTVRNSFFETNTGLAINLIGTQARGFDISGNYIHTGNASNQIVVSATQISGHIRANFLAANGGSTITIAGGSGDGVEICGNWDTGPRTFTADGNGAYHAWLCDNLSQQFNATTGSQSISVFDVGSIRFTNSSPTTITNFTNGAPGQRVQVFNEGSSTVTFTIGNTNAFFVPGASGTWTLGNGESAQFFLAPTNGRWVSTTNSIGYLKSSVMFFPEVAAPSALAGNDICYGDSTAHAAKCSYNNGSFFNVTQTIGTGNVTTAGTAINTLTCQAQTGITVTGAQTTDNVIANIGAALPATWQTGIAMQAHVTATNTVTVYLCNPTATATITPAATQVNVRVTR